MSREMDAYKEKMAGYGLVAICVIAGGAFILYLISSFWIYLWFYLLPFLIGSALVGLVLKFFTTFWVEQDFRETSSKYYLVYNYKALAFAYPLLIFVVLASFYFDSNYRVEVDKKNNTTITFLDWPGVNKYFNETKKSWYSDSWFESLRKEANVTEIYDRRNIGNIMFLTLFLGGPIVFFLLTLDDDEKEGKVIQEKIKAKVKREEDRLNGLIRDQQMIIEKRVALAEAEVAKVEAQKVVLAKENLVLKAKVEFVLPKTLALPPASGETRTTGILDKDIL